MLISVELYDIFFSHVWLVNLMRRIIIITIANIHNWMLIAFYRWGGNKLADHFHFKFCGFIFIIIIMYYLCVCVCVRCAAAINIGAIKRGPNCYISPKFFFSSAFLLLSYVRCFFYYCHRRCCDGGDGAWWWWWFISHIYDAWSYIGTTYIYRYTTHQTKWLIYSILTCDFHYPFRRREVNEKNKNKNKNQLCDSHLLNVYAARVAKVKVYWWHYKEKRETKQKKTIRPKNNNNENKIANKIV